MYKAKLEGSFNIGFLLFKSRKPLQRFDSSTKYFKNDKLGAPLKYYPENP